MTSSPRGIGSNPPEPILSNAAGSFAWGVLHIRHPAIIEQVREANPYSPDRQAALDQLLHEITHGNLERLPEDAHDHATWDCWGQDFYGQPWDAVPFLWAESYFYRRLLEALRYFRTGPWQGIDPFGPQKEAELHDGSLDAELATLDNLTKLNDQERLDACTDAALWGNRFDLGLRMSDRATPQRQNAADLVADEREVAWNHLVNHPEATIRLVADNAGRELLPDLVLTDHLIRMGLAAEVDIHLKPHPYYISDATTADLIGCLRRLQQSPGEAGQIGLRLWQALNEGRVTIGAHSFYCTPLTYHDAPLDLAEQYASATLTILKGDLNYRRLVGDLNWPATSSFADLTAYFPAPVVTLRTLKSDVVVGLGDKTLTALDARGGAWRTSGTHGLIQARL